MRRPGRNVDSLSYSAGMIIGLAIGLIFAVIWQRASSHRMRRDFERALMCGPIRDGYIGSILLSMPGGPHTVRIGYASREKADAAHQWLSDGWQAQDTTSGVWKRAKMENAK